MLLPRTDAGVAAQAVIAAVTLAAALVATWGSPELRRFVTGVTVMTVAFFGLRAIH